jgi:hypothetical protein
MSMSLKSIVDEILLAKSGKSIKKPTSRLRVKSMPYLTQNKVFINKQESNKAENNAQAKELNLVKDYRVKNDLAENDQFITNDDL